MKNNDLFLLLFFAAQFITAQIPPLEHLQLIETAEQINEPFELKKKLKGIADSDQVTLITFSKATGILRENVSISKTKLLDELDRTGFKMRYFVVLIHTRAIFYLE